MAPVSDDDRERDTRLHGALTDIAVLDAKFDALEAKFESLEKAVDKCVTKLEYAPTKLITFGLAALVLSGVVGALLKLVLLGHTP